MDELKKLFQAKRILAMMLAVAMAVTMLPVTTSAASLPDNGTAGQETGETSVRMETEGETVKIVYGFEDGRGEGDKTAVYNQYEQDFWAAMEKIYVTTSDGYKIPLEECGWSGYDGLSDLTRSWQKKVDGQYVPCPSNPVDAGEYQLVVTIPESETVAKAEKAFDFTVTPARLEVGIDPDPVEVTPGTVRKDVTEKSLIQSLYFYGDGESDIDDVYFTTNLDTENNNGEPLKPIDVVVSVGIAQIRDAMTGVEVKAEEQFKKNKDYVVDFEFKFNPDSAKERADNYILPEKVTKNITITGLVQTEIYIEYLKKDNNQNVIDEFGREYDGTEMTAPKAGEDYKATVRYEAGYDEEKGEPVYKEIAGAKLTESWHREDFDEYNPEASRMEGAPTETGVYFYVLSYEGEEGVYAKCSAPIMVEVRPATLVIVPIVEKDSVFYAGMTAAEVLAKLDYQVFRVLDAQHKEDYDKKVDRNGFWGTSYADKGLSQPYEPVLEIQEVTTEETVTEEGKTEKVQVTRTLADWETLESGKVYQAAFSGNKGVYGYGYYHEGAYIETYEQLAEINDSYYYEDGDGNEYATSDSAMDVNHWVDVSEAALKANVAAITVTAGTKADIDISAILQDGKGASADKAITKEYDGVRIYNQRADYKKASVKAGTASVVSSGTDKALTYTWKKYAGEEYSGKDDENGNPIMEEVWQSFYGISPVQAGDYKLIISYTDSEHKYNAEPKTVYYKISPLKVKLVPEGDFHAMTGYTADQFHEITDVTYQAWTVPTAAGVEPKQLDWVYGKDYRANWGVESKGADGSWSEFTGVFAEGGTYRLVVEDWDIYRNSNEYQPNYSYINYEETAASLNYFFDSKDIAVAKMGETELEMKTDPTKLSVANKDRVYDGEAIDIGQDIAGGLVSWVKKGTTDAVAADDIVYFWRDNTTYGRVDLDAAVNAGTYRLYAFFAGNKDYRALDSDTDYAFTVDTGIEVTVGKKGLSVSADMKGTLTGGQAAAEIFRNLTVIFDGAAAKDAAVLSAQGTINRNSYCYYYSDTDSAVRTLAAKVQVNVYDASGECAFGYDDDGNYHSSALKSNAEYTIKCTVELSGDFARNYEYKADQSKFEPVKTGFGNSSVKGVRYDDVRAVTVKDAKDGLTHTVTAKTAIPYSRTFKGNYIAVGITVPAEYRSLGSSMLYKNSMENAGAKAVYTSGGNMVVGIFEVKGKEESGSGETTNKYEFDILWEAGFKEHFVLDFSQAELMPNLAKAVAPKSLAFQNPGKKMAVGSTQQLDVKLSKAQNGDVIHLSYEVEEGKEDILTVSESGYVTALQEGSAKVTVYSSYLDDDGKWQPTVPSKSASVAITVTKVTMPKIKKVDGITDRGATVVFAPLTSQDGYRREIYVLAGSTKYTADNFENKIAEMKNGNWKGIFAIAPLYGKDFYSSSLKADCVNIAGLERDTEYTVYVRNVSAIRTLPDGRKTIETHNGAVKGFKTTKSQVRKLAIEFNEQEVQYDGGYTVEMKRKSTTVKVKGGFDEREVNAAAEAGDGWVWKDLALSKEEQKVYVNPKLTYMVGTWSSVRLPDREKDLLGVYDLNIYDHDVFYLYKTSIASIDKKGKLKLNGVGRVRILVKDANTGNWVKEDLDITASADGLTGKNVKLQVGDSILLEDLLTYKENGKAVQGYTGQVLVDEKLRSDIAADSEHFRLEDAGNGRYRIRVIKGGNKKLTLELTDTSVGSGKQSVSGNGVSVSGNDAGANAGGKAAVTLTATDLDPAKNLKATAVDQYFDLEFSHSGLAEGYRIEVRDARKDLLRSAYVKVSDLNSNSGAWRYDSDTNKYVYRVYGTFRQSKYSVSVTALYGDTSSKTATASVTTTVLPASYANLKGQSSTGGVGVYVHSKDRYLVDNYNSPSVYNKFRAGNSYTLELGGNNFNAGSKAAMTDTLTWTSSDKKVATIKANAGTYSAKLTALKSGSTVIEIRSKVTKAVIGRYWIYVDAVGEAYEDYYGEEEELDRVEVNEPKEPEATPSGPWNPNLPNNVPALKLGKGTNVSVDRGYRWLKFTAPRAGEFTFYSVGVYDSKAWFFKDMSIGNDAKDETLDIESWNEGYGNDDDDDDRLGITSGQNFAKKISLSRGETVYIAVGCYGLEGSLDAEVYVTDMY